MNNNPQEEFRSVCEILKKGEDQKWFIDYLRAIEPELDDPAMYPLLLMKHKEIVENGAEKYVKKPSVKAKYTWLSRYHNKLVKGLKKKWLSFYGIKSGDLRIVLNR
jgi:hypothetical protein